MTETQFLEDVKEALELDDRDLQMKDRFKEYEEWDSLTFLSLATLLNSRYGVSVDVDTFNRVETWEDLYSHITH